VTDETTLYELLGVERSADAATISKAWRRRTRKAGPGSPEFARLNEAAETLLNPERRAEYDASLPAVAPAAPAAPAAEAPAASATGATSSVSSMSSVFRAAIIAAAVLLVLNIAAFGWAFYQAHHKNQAHIDDARSEASAAARTAVGVLLGYSWKTMDADLKNDLNYLTPSYAKTFTDNFNLLTASKNGAPSAVAQTKTIVTASVASTAVMDASAERVNVLVFADQTVVHKAGSKKQECPCVLHDRVKVSMVKQGGKWLVDNLQTS